MKLSLEVHANIELILYSVIQDQLNLPTDYCTRQADSEGNRIVNSTIRLYQPLEVETVHFFVFFRNCQSANV